MTNEPSPDQATPLRGMGRGRPAFSLWLGATMVGVLVAANVAGALMEPEPVRLHFANQPPHGKILGALLTRAPSARQTLTPGGEGLSLWNGTEGDPRDTVIITSMPPASAQVGRRVAYQPSGAPAGSRFFAEGLPPGLTVSHESGLIHGRPEVAGRYRSVLVVKLPQGGELRQEFDLRVDDRALILGSDAMGRDVLKRTLRGARLTLLPGLIAVLVGVGGGLALGAISAFRGGVWERGGRTAVRVLESLPGLLVLFLAATISRFNILVVMAFVGAVLLPETANAVGEQVRAFKKRQFVEAARELGLSDAAILWREIVWYNLRVLLLVRTVQALLFAVLVEVTLAYLGLGVQDFGSWGSLLLEGRTAVAGGQPYYWLVAVPSAAILYCVVAFTLLERGLQGYWKAGS